MNKKVMALAVAGVLAAPAAFAQTSNVQLYGRAVLGIDTLRGADGCDASGPAQRRRRRSRGRIRIFDNSSRVGLRGTEDLGNGLKAIFQIETGVNDRQRQQHRRRAARRTRRRASGRRATRSSASTATSVA